MAGPASAGIWTEIASGTSAEITAIEYQSDTRFWFTTSTGEIWKRRADLSGFDNVRPANAIGLNDIEFQSGGDIGFAVGKNGTVLRSTNAGATWTPVTGIQVSNLGDGSGNKCTINTPLGEVNFVRFAGNSRVWIGGQDRQIATSQPPVAANVGATGWWVDANRKVPPVPGDNCWIEQGDGFADMFVTSNPNVFYIGTGVGDQVVYSANNLAGTPETRAAEIANGFVLSGSMAGDPANPNRMWAVSGAPYGNSTAQYTEDGYQTSHWFRVVNEASHDFPNYGAYDVDYAGGTVLSAGNAGYILHSTNGRDFYWNGADGALATQDWRAVGLASATQGAVGGLNGKLVVTTTANAIPTVTPPPTTPPAAPPPTTPGGSKRLPVSFTGRGNGLSAKVVGRRVRIRMRGTIRLPAGANIRAACTGKVRLAIKRKRKTLRKVSARLKVRNGRCRFGKTVFIKRRKVGRSTTRLRLRVSFRGNAALAAGSTTKTLVIKR